MERTDSSTPRPPPLSRSVVHEAEPPTLNPVPLSQVPLPTINPGPSYFDGRKFGLPQGWLIEQRPRNSSNYIGKVDQFFYDPHTGKQFRSLKSVEEHLGMQFPALTKVQQTKQTTPPTQLGDDPRMQSPNGSKAQTSNSIPRKKKRTFSFDFANVPQSVTWTLTDAGNDTWTPFIGEARVPDDLEDNWTKTFTNINNAKRNASNS